MNPCYNQVDVGRDRPHYGLLYPFAARPDVSVRVLWFPVPLDAVNVIPPTPFVLRNWDRLDKLPQTKPGSDQDFVEYYNGPLPLNFPGTPCGSPLQWEGQIDYDVWVEGGYSCNCPAMLLPKFVSSVRCDDGSLDVSPAFGDVEVHINVGHENTWVALQTFDARPDPTKSALLAWGNNGSQDVLLMELHGNGLSYCGAQVAIGQNSLIANTRCIIFTPPSWVGLDIRNFGHGSATWLLLMEGGGATATWGVAGNGTWKTNTTTATPLNTLGNVVAKYPIYDLTGTLIGYVPIFDSIT